ncbi:hypothetical protein NDU88_004526 [Pleurodeles waltl]|uniref:Uncharacterized protein n=1 Tax=Pleurodeles waltl TaxID=8319 RepID=A0AAV7LUW1_PLEWA|nr:hypothetical protein NDU88_004526 [Pleurodeles waltl]
MPTVGVDKMWTTEFANSVPISPDQQVRALVFIERYLEEGKQQKKAGLPLGASNGLQSDGLTGTLESGMVLRMMTNQRLNASHIRGSDQAKSAFKHSSGYVLPPILGSAAVSHFGK